MKLMIPPSDVFCPLCGTLLTFTNPRVISPLSMTREMQAYIVRHGTFFIEEGICEFVDCMAVWAFDYTIDGKLKVRLIREDVNLDILANRIISDLNEAITMLESVIEENGLEWQSIRGVRPDYACANYRFSSIVNTD